jgi:hypothetical protein
MQAVLIKTLLALCGCLVIGSICYGIGAAVASISPRKGGLRRMATVLFGSAIAVASLAMFFSETSLPVTNAIGNISFVQVHPSGKDYRTDVLLQTSTGSTLAVFARGRSPLFLLGERVALTYQTQTGLIVKAHFIAIDGREEGVFNSANSWAAAAGVLVGIFIIWTAFKVHKRDPEGAEESGDHRRVPLDSVDEGSLPHLSDNHQD